MPPLCVVDALLALARATADDACGNQDDEGQQRFGDGGGPIREGRTGTLDKKTWWSGERGLEKNLRAKRLCWIYRTLHRSWCLSIHKQISTQTTTVKQHCILSFKRGTLITSYLHEKQESLLEYMHDTKAGRETSYQKGAQRCLPSTE